jgi:hypothetical protein
VIAGDCVDVRVKVLPKVGNENLIDRETNALGMNRNSENVIKRVSFQEDQNYYFVAYETWETCLKGLVLNASLGSPKEEIITNVLRDATRGVVQLHTNSVTSQRGDQEPYQVNHRNIRPNNILVLSRKEEKVGKISDLRYSKRFFPEEDQSLSCTLSMDVSDTSFRLFKS